MDEAGVKAWRTRVICAVQWGVDGGKVVENEGGAGQDLRGDERGRRQEKLAYEEREEV